MGFNNHFFLFSTMLVKSFPGNSKQSAYPPQTNTRIAVLYYLDCLVSDFFLIDIFN